MTTLPHFIYILAFFDFVFFSWIPLTVSEIQVGKLSVNGEVDDPKLNKNEGDVEGEHDPQERNEAVRGEEESDPQHENDDTIEEPQNEHEAGQDDAKAPEIEDGKPLDESEKGEKEDASCSEEESIEESDTESDSEYSSTESSDEEHADHSSGDREVSGTLLLNYESLIYLMKLKRMYMEFA